jgi:hypothetical protein
MKSIMMHLVEDGLEWHCEAEGSWNLLCKDKKSPHEEPAALDSNEGQLQMVAEAGF